MTPIVPDPAVAAPVEASQAVNGTPLPELDPEVIPNLDTLVTQDDTPVDSIYTEKLQRLLTEPLYTSWSGPGEGRTFLALTNVGWFYAYRLPPLVPDFLLSLDVAPAGDLRTKEGHSYYQWLMGKSPEVVIEVVSDRRGGEDDLKMRTYARWGALFYVILDPEDCLRGGLLRAFVLDRLTYRAMEPQWLPEVGLGLTLWDGTFEGVQTTWLRWCDRDGRVIPTGPERAEEERQRAAKERRRADEERRRADERIQRLAAQLRAHGIEPEA